MSNTGDRAAWLKGGLNLCAGTGAPPSRSWRLVLLGAPGIGKGTQAALLEERLGACQLSTGDVFRAARSEGCCLTPVMEDAMAHMRAGRLVPDELVIDMVRERSRCMVCSHGFLLDGFPRTTEQAEALEKMLSGLGVQLDAVLSFDLDLVKVIERLSGRRTCPNCRKSYHVTSQPPSQDGVCDVCCTPLIQREDDRPEAVRVRLDAYEAQTAPLRDFYASRGLLRSVAADGPPEVVSARTLAALGVKA